jgi:hypothetical protein
MANFAPDYEDWPGTQWIYDRVIWDRQGPINKYMNAFPFYITHPGTLVEIHHYRTWFTHVSRRFHREATLIDKIMGWKVRWKYHFQSYVRITVRLRAVNGCGESTFVDYTYTDFIPGFVLQEIWWPSQPWPDYEHESIDRIPEYEIIDVPYEQIEAELEDLPYLPWEDELDPGGPEIPEGEPQPLTDFVRAWYVSGDRDCHQRSTAYLYNVLDSLERGAVDGCVTWIGDWEKDGQAVWTAGSPRNTCYKTYVNGWYKQWVKIPYSYIPGCSENFPLS